MRNTCAIVLAAALVAACAEGEDPISPRPAANILVNIPEDSPGPPFYSLIQPGWFPVTDDWGAVAWLRDPACVPDDFNILQLIDPPPRPFFCALTIEGHAVAPSQPRTTLRAWTFATPRSRTCAPSPRSTTRARAR